MMKRMGNQSKQKELLGRSGGTFREFRIDVEAKDALGSIFNIEMQLTVTTGLIKRVVFYGCELYPGQLSNGRGYHLLQPVYSICILDDLVWESGVDDACSENASY